MYFPSFATNVPFKHADIISNIDILESAPARLIVLKPLVFLYPKLCCTRYVCTTLKRLNATRRRRACVWIDSRVFIKSSRRPLISSHRHARGFSLSLLFLGVFSFSGEGSVGTCGWATFSGWCNRVTIACRKFCELPCSRDDAASSGSSSPRSSSCTKTVRGSEKCRRCTS